MRSKMQYGASGTSCAGSPNALAEARTFEDDGVLEASAGETIQDELIAWSKGQAPSAPAPRR
jgi:hypothetical protein